MRSNNTAEKKLQHTPHKAVDKSVPPVRQTSRLKSIYKKKKKKKKGKKSVGKQQANFFGLPWSGRQEATVDHFGEQRIIPSHFSFSRTRIETSEVTWEADPAVKTWRKGGEAGLYVQTSSAVTPPGL